MEFKVYRTDEWYKATKMKFDSIEELLEFTKQKQQEKKSIHNSNFSDYETRRIHQSRHREKRT